ncbi:RUS family member 1 [Centruroides vittatus]|uniref:RUS family member 1 n=1 Tax=Centruroides vittatus TaxID=120091 RepID=UPI003510975F
MENGQIVCFENYGSSTRRRRYIMENRCSRPIMIDNERRFSSLKNFFTSVFLPQGYPDSVSKDYLTYQLWDSIQAFASSITGTLSTHAVLKGVGVGDETATPMAATITWLLKYGTGMVGRILFAWMNGSNLDCDPKKWRLFADFLNDVAIFIDLLSPFMKSIFTFVLCLSAVSKSLVGVAGGATRAALTQHQALRNNMADVSAKDGSQETLVNLTALICSLIIMPAVSGSQMLIWTFFVLFTLIHLFANYKAVSAVVMDTFNIERFQITVNHYLSSQFDLMSVPEINKRESVFIKLWNVTPKIGISLSETLQGYCDFYTLQDIYRKTFYFLNIKRNKGYTVDIMITLHNDSNVHTQMEALFQACILESALKKGKTKKNSWQMKFFPEQLTKDNAESILRTSREITVRQYPSFLEHLARFEWNTNHVFFKTDEWRAEWNTKSNKIETL